MTRRLLAGLVGAAMAVCVGLVGASAAQAEFAYVVRGSQAGIRADITTPTASFSGVPYLTTVKAALFLGYSYTNCGWLIRPGDYNSPETYYVWRESDGTLHEVPVSGQSYNFTRAYELRYAGSTVWNIYITGTPRHYSIDSLSTSSVQVGGKTSALNANLRGSVTNAQSTPTLVPLQYGVLTQGNSSEVDAFPLLVDMDSYNYAFHIRNANY